MPTIESPPKLTTGVPPPPLPESDLGPSPYSQPKTAPILISTRRHGEVDHSELVRMLDMLEGDQSKSRFRESIYISIIFYLALAWLVVYGPRYVFHQGRVVPSAAELKEKQRLTDLALNQDLTKLNQPKPAPKPPPKIDRKLLDQLKQMQQASEAAKAVREKAPEAPAPQPAAPPPPPTVAKVETPTPLPAAPTPQPKAAIPDSPQPNNLPAAPSAAPSARSSVEDAARAAAASRLGGRMSGGGSGARVGQQSAGSGFEILSDTRGVDFSDWLKRLKRVIMASWIPQIPEEVQPPLNKEGWTLIRITVEPNGTVTVMHLDDSSKDRAIDKAAWGAITGVGQLPPLPKEFSGPNLELRMQFVISHNPADLN